MKSVYVSLPKQLPSRLTTLQKACPEATFAANPVNCRALGSEVGSATVTTPVLPGKLKGSAYLVSHGGEAFPDLDIVLEGDGITVILTGNTKITKGITSSTFAAIPDVPVTSFVLNLPVGPHSALTCQRQPLREGAHGADDDRRAERRAAHAEDAAIRDQLPGADRLAQGRRPQARAQGQDVRRRARQPQRQEPEGAALQTAREGEDGDVHGPALAQGPRRARPAIAS